MLKKKLFTILTVSMSIALAACSSEKVEEGRNKIKKNVESDLDKVSSEIQSVIDDETDLFNLTGETETDNKESVPSESTAVSESSAADFDPDVKFSIEDLDGNEITEEEFSKHKVTMINFWEPWCGPCVNEMPELEKLYETYKDKGLYIIGVFSATDQVDDVKKIVSDAGTTYPIASYDTNFDVYQTGYVPTTIFVDQNGHVLPASNGYSDNAIVGGNSYDDWAKIVDGFLK